MEESGKFKKLLDKISKISQKLQIEEQPVDENANQDKRKKKPKIIQFEESPEFMDLPLKGFQIDGLNWMIRLYENGVNGILADEMGLGKTIQTIAMLGYLYYYKNIEGKHLILGPKSVVDNWKMEFERFCPDFRVVKFVGSADERKKIASNLVLPGKFDVLLGNYEVLALEHSTLRKFKWKFIVVDEGHRMKNEHSKFAINIRALSSTNRLILTGTPLQNTLHELWALLNYLLPTIFNSSSDFDEWFDTNEVLAKGETLVQQLQTVLQPFILRRIKADVETSLLPKQEFRIFTGITKLQRELYIKVLEKEFVVINHGTGARMNNNNIGAVLMNLRKICNHPYNLEQVEPEPYVTDESLITCSGKMIILDKLLTMLKEQGSKVLIFSQFIMMLHILEDYLTWKGYKYCRLDGNTDYEQRSSDITAFNASDDYFVYLLSTKAGGLGINLQTADSVIIYDSDWNPQNDIQGIARSHRIGQKKQVRVFTLISENTIDERIVQRAAIKLLLDQKVIEEGGLVPKESFNKREALNMLMMDRQKILESTESTITDGTIQEILKESEEKSRKLDEKVKNSEIDFENFDTIYKYEGKLYNDKEKESRNLFNAGPSARSRGTNDMVIEINSDDEGDEVVTVKQEPEDFNYERPLLYEYQFCDPRLQDILMQEYFHFLKRKHNDRTKKIIEEMSEEDRQKVESAKALTVPTLLKKRQFLTDAFMWKKEEFDQYLNGLVEHGGQDLKSIAAKIPSKSFRKVENYHRMFMKKFFEFTDPSIKVLGIRIFYDAQVKPHLEKIREKLDGNFDSLTSNHIKMLQFPHEYIKFMCKKLWEEGRSNSNVYVELLDELMENEDYKPAILRFKVAGLYNKLTESDLPKLLIKVLISITERLELVPKTTERAKNESDNENDDSDAMSVASDGSEYLPSPSHVLKPVQKKIGKTKEKEKRKKESKAATNGKENLEKNKKPKLGI